MIDLILDVFVHEVCVIMLLCFSFLVVNSSIVLEMKKQAHVDNLIFNNYFLDAVSRLHFKGSVSGVQDIRIIRNRQAKPSQ